MPEGAKAEQHFVDGAGARIAGGGFIAACPFGWDSSCWLNVNSNFLWLLSWSFATSAAAVWSSRRGGRRSSLLDSLGRHGLNSEFLLIIYSLNASIIF
jgi:hypothetical protein